MTPLAIDLFCGLGGWTEGLLAEGYRVVGFDIERHEYGDAKYPAQLVLQDVLTVHGSQFKDAALIVASPPCQAYSYRAMPWSRAKALPPPDNTLFEACFRIQREACEAAGRYIPLVVENVRGAQKWVGRARWNFGSFYLWGDVPALMPMTKKVLKSGWLSQADGAPMRRDDRAVKESRLPLNREIRGQDFTRVAGHQAQGMKNNGGSWFNIAHNTTSGHGQNPDGRKGMPHRTAGHWTNPAEHEDEGMKQRKSGRAWFADPNSISGSTSGKSNSRKAASAMIAKIPFVLAQHIALVWKPRELNI